MVQALQDNSGLDPALRSQLLQLSSIWDRVQELSDLRETKLNEALELAEQFNEATQVVRNWLPEVEAELKFHSIPDDEDSIMQQIENHEKFQEELRGQQTSIDRIRMLAEEILQSCHPNAVRFVKYYLTITHTRWEQALSRSNQRAIKLQEMLRVVRTNAALVEELMVYLTDCHALLSTKEKDSIPDDLLVVEALVKEHAEFQEDLSSKSQDVEKLIKSLPAAASTNRRQTSGRQSLGGGRQADNHDVTSQSAAGAAALQKKWQLVSRMSAERHKKLQEVHNRLLEAESLRNFNFDEWRTRYITWTRANKLKYIDFFRRLDKEGSGQVMRKDFIDGILASKFPSSAAELSAVFGLFDVHKTGRIYYKTFLDAIMRPDKEFTPLRAGSRQLSEADKIHAEVEDQLAQCQCHSQFAMLKVGDAKYKFGDKENVRQLRMLNGSVYVRFASSFMPLAEFLATVDPCREKPVVRGFVKSGMNSRLSGSATNLLAASSSSPRTTQLSLRSLGGSGLAGQRNGPMAKSWSNLSSFSMSSPLSPRTPTGTGTSSRSLHLSTSSRPVTPSTSSSEVGPRVPSLSIPPSLKQQQQQRKPSVSSSITTPSSSSTSSPRPPHSPTSDSMRPFPVPSHTATPLSSASRAFAASLRSGPAPRPTPATHTSSTRGDVTGRATPTGNSSATTRRTPTTMSGRASPRNVTSGGLADGAARRHVTSTAAGGDQQRKTTSSLRNSSPAPTKHVGALRSYQYSPAQDIDF